MKLFMTDIFHEKSTLSSTTCLTRIPEMSLTPKSAVSANRSENSEKSSNFPFSTQSCSWGSGSPLRRAASCTDLRALEKHFWLEQLQAR